MDYFYELLSLSPSLLFKYLFIIAVFVHKSPLIVWQPENFLSSTCILYYSDGVYTHGVDYATVLELSPIQIILILLTFYINVLGFSLSKTILQFLNVKFFYSLYAGFNNVLFNSFLTKEQRYYIALNSLLDFLYSFRDFFLFYHRVYYYRMFYALWITWILSPSFIGFVYILLMVEAPAGVILFNVTVFEIPLFYVILNAICLALLSGVKNLSSKNPDAYENWVDEILFFYFAFCLCSLFLGGVNDCFWLD